MTDLLGKLLDKIADPVLVTVIISSVLVVFLLWRFFGKHYEFVRGQVDILKQVNEESQKFIRERVDMLRQENEDLRKQIQIFRDENERLRKASSMLAEAVEQIRAQPLLTEQQLEELHVISERAKQAAENNVPATREVLESSLRLIEAVREMENISGMSLNIQREGFSRLEHAISERAPNREVIEIVQQLIHLIGESQHTLGDRIMQLEEQARRLSVYRDSGQRKNET
jgi:hypothetical protein